MLTQQQVICLSKYVDFRNKKVLVVGRLSSAALQALQELKASVNHLHPDIVIYWGLLTGTSAEIHLEYAARKCACLVVESDVLDTSENMSTKTLTKIKPSAAYVESILLRQGFGCDMIVDEELNVGNLTYTWPVQETWSCLPNMRRVWVATKRVPRKEKEDFS